MDLAYRILAYVGILATAFFAGMIHGCQSERDKWELASAQAKVEAANETQRRIEEKNRLLDESRQREAKLAVDRDNARSAVGMLKQALAGRGGNTTVAGQCQTDLTARELLGNCAERYQWMAGEADKANATGSLCATLYGVISNKQQVKNFLRDSK